MTKWQRYGVGLQCTGACDWLEVTVSASLCPSFLNSPLEASGQTKPDPTDLKKGLGQRQVTRIKQGTAFSNEKKPPKKQKKNTTHIIIGGINVDC